MKRSLACLGLALACSWFAGFRAYPARGVFLGALGRQPDGTRPDAPSAAPPAAPAAGEDVAVLLRAEGFRDASPKDPAFSGAADRERLALFLALMDLGDGWRSRALSDVRLVEAARGRWEPALAAGGPPEAPDAGYGFALADWPRYRHASFFKRLFDDRDLVEAYLAALDRATRSKASLAALRLQRRFLSPETAVYARYEGAPPGALVLAVAVRKAPPVEILGAGYGSNVKFAPVETGLLLPGRRLGAAMSYRRLTFRRNEPERVDLARLRIFYRVLGTAEIRAERAPPFPL